MGEPGAQVESQIESPVESQIESSVEAPIESLSAVTLATADMASSTRFYESVGFVRRYGGPESEFTSYLVGDGFLNIQLDPAHAPVAGIWGRVIFWVADVDATYDRVRAAGYDTLTSPCDAPWGERYFHVHDPDGHELSFARPLASGSDASASDAAGPSAP